MMTGSQLVPLAGLTILMASDQLFLHAHDGRHASGQFSLHSHAGGYVFLHAHDGFGEVIIGGLGRRSVLFRPGRPGGLFDLRRLRRFDGFGRPLHEEEPQALDVDFILAAEDSQDRVAIAAQRPLAAAGPVADPLAGVGIARVELPAIDAHELHAEAVDIQT